ncbi:MAG: polyphenol oxidase family protein [Nesterenkonia sp.]|nr:polyphenol oxidase family protein [Nesterenkonia sp.]
MEAPFWRHLDAGDGVHVAFTRVEAGNLSLSAGVTDADDPAHARRAALASRRRLEATMGVPQGGLRFLHQTHSADVVDAAAASGPQPPIGDAWLSTDASAALAIMVADCLPVMFVGRVGERPMTAGAHAGRVGLLGGVLENTVAAMRTAGAQEISAWIGPGACGRCYEVPESLRAESSEGRPALASETRWGTPALDLRAEAAAVLASREVTVTDVAGCTIEDEDLFSHRRAPGRGRFAGLVWRNGHD